MARSFNASTALDAMILSLPEMEFEVMSVSSSIAVSVTACFSALVFSSPDREPLVAAITASVRMRTMMFDGSRKRNTWAKYGAMSTRQPLVDTSITSKVARGANPLRNDTEHQMPLTQVMT